MRHVRFEARGGYIRRDDGGIAPVILPPPPRYHWGGRCDTVVSLAHGKLARNDLALPVRGRRPRDVRAGAFQWPEAMTPGRHWRGYNRGMKKAVGFTSPKKPPVNFFIRRAIGQNWRRQAARLGDLIQTIQTATPAASNSHLFNYDAARGKLGR